MITMTQNPSAHASVSPAWPQFSPNRSTPSGAPGSAPRNASWWPGWRPDAWRFEGPDVMEQMQMSDAADRSLLRLVLCVTAATLVLALVCSLLG
jgi:hypothetical protein